MEHRMPTYNIHEAKSQLSKLIEAMQQGETVIIARSGKPVAVLGPVPASAGRVRGVLRGQINLRADFDEPLPAELLKGFEGME
jgi:prevent-host-death family protein